MTIHKYKFDFEVGTLIKSPCENCKDRKEFPKCIKKCLMLDKIQRALAETRSTAKQV